MATTKKKLPAGYKQTEAGVIPADWDLVSYEEAFKFLLFYLIFFSSSFKFSSILVTALIKISFASI